MYSEWRALTVESSMVARAWPLANRTWEFRQDSNVKILFSVYKFSCKGHHLVATNHIMSMDMWWNCQVVEQAMTRCFRVGQIKDIHYYPLVTENSIEAYMNMVCLRKLEDIRKWYDHQSARDMYKDLLSDYMQYKSTGLSDAGLL